MKSYAKLFVLISILFAVIATVTTLVLALIYFDKKKSERELERYLDCSIQ